MESLFLHSCISSVFLLFLMHIYDIKYNFNKVYNKHFTIKTIHLKMYKVISYIDTDINSLDLIIKVYIVFQY